MPVPEGQGLSLSPSPSGVNLEAIDPIKVDLQVPERHAGAIRAGQAITVRVDAFPGQEYTGEVYAVDPGLDPRAHSAPCACYPAAPAG